MVPITKVDWQRYKDVEAFHDQGHSYASAQLLVAQRDGCGYDAVRLSRDKVAKSLRKEDPVKDLAESTAQMTPGGPSAARLDKLVKRGLAQWTQVNKEFAKLDRWVRFAKLSDKHIPYQDNAAIELAALIVEDYDPDLVVNGDDACDFNGLGRWPDARLAYQKIWDEDIANIRIAIEKDQLIWSDAAPNAAHVWINGNHEDRLDYYLSKYTGPTYLDTKCNFVEHLQNIGIIWMGDIEALEVSPGLVLRHGKYASKNRATCAKNNAEEYGYQRSVAAGHAHGMGQYIQRGADYDIMSLVGGCLCNLQPHWSTKRQNWQHGIILGAYEHSGHHAVLYQVPFVHTGGYIVAHFEGKEYRVKEYV